jgi:hypothetical protein
MPSQTSARSAGHATEIAVVRIGSMVRFEIMCSSDYDAMMLEDRMTEELRGGCVKLEISTKPKEVRRA